MAGATAYLNRLKDLREAAGKSRLDIAVTLKVSEHTARRLEEPETDIPSKYIPALAQLVNADERHLMGWDREPTGAAS